MNQDTPLGRVLAMTIAQNGPISLEHYMTQCLYHPHYGYYTTKIPFGAAGDFITAPEISQMFGELIGLWMAEVMGAFNGEERLHLVELGPGRGTLLSDLMRAVKIVPQLYQRLHLHLVETSPRLASLQKETLAPAGLPLVFHDSIASLPHAPIFVIANEFFDCLPLRQYQYGKTHPSNGQEGLPARGQGGWQGGWHERLIGLDGEGALAFGLAPVAEPSLKERAEDGTILEINANAYLLMTDLARHLVRYGGAALVLDYGHGESVCGESLQAVRQHRPVHPLDYPGEADLTAHVDFAALARAARAVGAVVDGPVTQGRFLIELGLFQRARGLKQRANTDQAHAIDSACVRLVGHGEKDMGLLFKVLCVRAPNSNKPAGFDWEPAEGP